MTYSAESLDLYAEELPRLDSAENLGVVAARTGCLSTVGSISTVASTPTASSGSTLSSASTWVPEERE